VDAHDPNLVKKVGIIFALIGVFVVILICVGIYLKYTGHNLTTLFKKERKSDIEMAERSETATPAAGPNTPFLERHLAMLRAWKKPAALDKGKAAAEPTNRRQKKTYSTKGRDAAAAYYLNKKGNMPTIAEESETGPSGTNSSGQQTAESGWVEQPLHHYQPN
jgi:hypothetical protein